MLRQRRPFASSWLRYTEGGVRRAAFQYIGGASQPARRVAAGGMWREMQRALRAPRPPFAARAPALPIIYVVAAYMLSRDRCRDGAAVLQDSACRIAAVGA